MWKEKYSKFIGLTKKTYEEYRYGLTSHGYWIYQEEPDVDSMGELQILYLDSDDGCLLFSSESDRFQASGMQIKPIGCQWADITPKTLREITGIMSKFIATRQRMAKKAAMNNLLLGEAYPGQRKKLKKRDEQIYKERISEGTTYRELGIKHGGLSTTRVSEIVAKQERVSRLTRKQLETLYPALAEELARE